VATGVGGEHCPRQQAFTPQRHESFGVQVANVYRSKPQRVNLRATARLPYPGRPLELLALEDKREQATSQQDCHTLFGRSEKEPVPFPRLDFDP
jgi:hypothetical protein